MAERDPWYLSAAPLATRPWLIRLRWTTAAIEASVALAVWLLPRVDLPLDHLVGVVAVAAAVNAAIALATTRGTPIPRAAVAAALAVDSVLLTGLLELTGGPFNPFIVVYAVQIALAAVTLGSIWAWLVAAVCGGGYAVLIYWHTMELVPGHHRLNDFPTHLFTIWIALAIAAELAAHFVEQIATALARREAALEAMRMRAAQSERVLALTTLAAGAAHELSTPLATIAVAARELERTAERGLAAEVLEDTRLIRAQVERCRSILDSMSGRAGGVSSDAPEAVKVGDLLAGIRERLPPECGRRLAVRVAPAAALAWLPRAGFDQVVSSLISNAFDASAGTDAPVTVDVTADAARLRVSICDEGPGMTPDGLRRAGEPFYTTKDAGRGIGLGLFLARVFAERFGGSLRLESSRGTTAIVELPLHATEGHHA